MSTNQPTNSEDQPILDKEDEAQLLAVDLDSLDVLEVMFYEKFESSVGKARALQIIINTMEGDYSQLSPELAAIAQLQEARDQAR